MTKTRILSSVILAATLALGGCLVRGHASGGFYATGPDVVVVESEPPPPRVVVMPAARPGFIWIEGRWDWRGGRWMWMDGRWERERVGYVWAPGRWERRGRGHVWVEGRWNGGGGGRGRGTKVIHTDNNNGRGNKHDGGVIIRDHRR
jgi:hypothetical protein